VGRKRYAYCATQIHGAPPEMGITHLVEVMEPNGARHDRAALRLLWETSRAIQVTALNTLATLERGPGKDFDKGPPRSAQTCHLSRSDAKCMRHT
jgi:hypothetical protein